MDGLFAPFINCTTPTRIPWPRARASMPKPALLLPLPLPVCSRSTPWSRVASAIFASTTVFLRAMRVWWRALRAASSLVVMLVLRGCGVRGCTPAVLEQKFVQWASLRPAFLLQHRSRVEGRDMAEAQDRHGLAAGGYAE